MVAPIFQESAFVWACVTLAGGCLAVAVAVRTRHFLHELSEQFIRLPPSGKAVFVAAVVVATVFAQKPTNVSTNQPESARAEEGVSATLAEGMPTASDTCAEETQGVSEGRSQSDSEHSELPARAREETEGGRHGEGFEGGDPTVASTTPANSPCLSNSVTSVLSVADTPPLSSNDVVRGYRLEMVRTNEAISYTRPTNARLVGTWHLTDAYRGRARVMLGEEGKGKREKGRSADGQLLPSSLFLFPLGPHVVTSLWAHTWGKVRPQLRNASNEIYVIGAPMFARHDQSYLWTAATANGSVLLTWENFFLGNPYEGGKVPSGEVLGGEGVGLSSTHRSTFPPFHFSTVSAQLELRGNGDFIARSNTVERVYRRVNPDDWDDDGIPNDEDPAPLAPAGAPQFGPHQDLSGIAHSNNYYWVDLISPAVNALVTFKGSGASNLPDPSFVAKVGATNRVTLLLGKSYTVDCRLPLVCVGASHPDVEVGEDRNGHLTVCRPVRCEIVDDSPVAAFRASTAAPHAASGGRRLRFTPAPDGFDVTWNGNYCCLEPPPPPFTVPLFNCDGNCGCGGCAVGTYTCRFEGFELSFPNWPCGCSHESPPDEPSHPSEDEPDHEPQGPHVSARFSEAAIIFEDEYENAPGEMVSRRSTEAEAEFSVYGGTKGGAYSFELRDGGRLERAGGSFVPREGKLEAGESFKIKVRYRARSASGSAGDVKAVATFTEEESGEEITSEATLTAVKVVITPVVAREGFPNRHKMGVRENFRVDAYPQGLVSIRLSPNWIQTPDDAYVCPVRADGNGLEIKVSDVSYVPNLTVVEPTGILCTSGFNRCTDGLIAMELEPYITPLDVSFFGIKVMEVPTTGSVPIGYFANPLFEPIWNHTKERKAGVWYRPRQDNYFFADAPSFGEYCPPPLSRGVIDWAIPLAWGDDDAEDVPDAVGGVETVYHQVFTLDDEGGLRIDKFTQWIHCSADGVVTHSPGIR